MKTNINFCIFLLFYTARISNLYPYTKYMIKYEVPLTPFLHYLMHLQQKKKILNLYLFSYTKQFNKQVKHI